MRIRVLTELLAKASLSAMLGVAALLGSCIKDDLSNCPPHYNVHLRLKTDAEVTGTTNYLDRYGIETVTVYVFDKDGKFVTLWNGGPYTIGQEYDIPLHLGSGKYTFVAVTNLGDTYTTNYTVDELYAQKPSINEVLMSLNVPAGGIISGDIPDLHYGVLPDKTIDGLQSYNLDMVVAPKTYKVNFTVTGVNNTGVYTFDVSDTPYSSTLNDVVTVPQPRMDDHYRRNGQFTGNQLTTSMIMVDLASGKNMPFTITNSVTGEVYSGDLINMIETAYRNSPNLATLFDNTFEFNIELSLASDMSVTITVNGWKYQDTGGDKPLY